MKSFSVVSVYLIFFKICCIDSFYQPKQYVFRRLTAERRTDLRAETKEGEDKVGKIDDLVVPLDVFNPNKDINSLPG
jgi:hypothetical protein